MKKLSLLLICGVLIFSLVGCGNNAITIENYDWELTFVQDAKGSVIACGSKHYEAHKEFENIEVIDLACTAINGEIDIKDETNNKTYDLTYKMVERDGDATMDTTIYEVKADDKTYNAVTSMTIDDKGNETPTLIISNKEHSLTFIAE